MVLSTKSVPFDVLEGYVKEFRELLSLLDIARFQVYHFALTSSISCKYQKLSIDSLQHYSKNSNPIF